jgi:hypothetical protein
LLSPEVEIGCIVCWKTGCIGNLHGASGQAVAWRWDCLGRGFSALTVAGVQFCWGRLNGAGSEQGPANALGRCQT